MEKPVRHCIHRCYVKSKDIFKRLTIKNLIYKQCKAVCCCEGQWAPQKLLPVICCLIWGVSISIDTSTFAHHGGHDFDYSLMSTHSPWMTQVAWRQTIDAPLALIFSTQSLCHSKEFRLGRWWIVCLWIYTVKRPSDSPWCTSKKDGCSGDIHFEHGATSKLLISIAVMPTNTFPLERCDETAPCLLKVQE